MLPRNVFEKRFAAELTKTEIVTQRELAKIIQHKAEIEWSRMELKKLYKNVKRKMRGGATVEDGPFKAIYGPKRRWRKNESGTFVGIDLWILKVK